MARGADLLHVQGERCWRRPSGTGTRTRPGSGRPAGVPLVIGRREGYVIHDVDGKRLHRHAPQRRHLQPRPPQPGDRRRGDAGHGLLRHRQPPLPLGRPHRAGRRRWSRPRPTGIAKVMFGSGGGEAIDLALKSARHATGRRRIVSVVKAYHGHTGLAVGTGDERFARLFLSRPARRVHPRAVQRHRRDGAGPQPGDVAAVIMETIPATYGFPLPAPGYLKAVKELCERHGALYIADEVQTGLMRTGELWAITKHGVAPDLLVTGQGPVRRHVPGGGGPGDRAGRRLDGGRRLRPHGHLRRGRGGLHRRAALPGDHDQARGAGDVSHHIAAFFRPGLDRIRAKYPDWFTGVRQDGLVMGLEFAHPRGRQVRHAPPVRPRGVGDLLHARPARPAVQARPAARPGDLRGDPGEDRGGHRRGPRGRGRPSAQQRPPANRRPRRGPAAGGRGRASPLGDAPVRFRGRPAAR